MQYSYKCTTCNVYFTVERPMSSPIIKGKHRGVKCPVHRTSKGIYKTISKPNVVFKGTGFTKGSVQ